MADFWRELVFGALILLGLFFFLGYKSRGDEITRLKAQVVELRSDQSTVSDTAQAKPSPDSNVAEKDEAEASTEPDQPYEGFKIKDNDLWTFTEGDATKGYYFTNGTKTVDVLPQPPATTVGADIIWKFDITEDQEESQRAIKLTDENEVFCQQGQENCTFGDGKLQVLVNQNITGQEKAELRLFFTDTGYAPDGDSFTTLQSFIELIDLN